jgi:hypothetical protein
MTYRKIQRPNIEYIFKISFPTSAVERCKVGVEFQILRIPDSFSQRSLRQGYQSLPMKIFSDYGLMTNRDIEVLCGVRNDVRFCARFT